MSASLFLCYQFFFMLGKEGVTDTIRLTFKQLQERTAFVLFAVLLY